MMASVEKVVIDTDCGIDDAMALLLAFSNPSSHKVMAITCCHGNAALDDVCKNVKRVLNVCGKKDVPVHRGCAGALVSGKRTESWKSFHGSDGFGNCSHLFPSADIEESVIPAAEALVQLSLKYPEQINLVAVGPLTNVALAHRLDHQFTKRLKSLSIMGGNCKGIGNETTVAEFNFYADPEAADIVLAEVECPVLMVPWETTRSFGIDWATYQKLTEVSSPKGQLLKSVTKFRADLSRQSGCPSFYDCDLLAVAAILYPQSVTSCLERSPVVECQGTVSRGMTILLNETNPLSRQRKKVKIVTEMDLSYLNELRFKMLN